MRRSLHGWQITSFAHAELGIRLQPQRLHFLNLIYNIPVLVIMSWRGCGGNDAPEHIIMGDINEPLLKTSGMEYAVLDENNVDQVLTTALKKIKEEKLPYTLLVKKGMFDERH